MTDKFYLILFLVVCTLLLILSIVMSIKSMNKEGGMSDVLSQELLCWSPFDFMEKYFKIDRLKYVGLQQVFRYGIREDYFYSNISKKMNIVELKDYMAVRAKINFYEKKWYFCLWVMPVVVIVCIPLMPVNSNVDKYLVVLPFALIFFTIHKLRAMPYRDEFLAVQKRILHQIYDTVFEDNLFDSIKLEVKLRKINRVRVLSYYYKLEEIVEQMNLKHIE